MKHLSLIILLAVTPLSWGEIKFDCKGERKVGMGAQERISEATVPVYLQNEKRPFTLRYQGETLEVDFGGPGNEYYRGEEGELGSIPYRSVSIHRMTLKFSSLGFYQQFWTAFSGNCKKAGAFKPKI